MSTPKGSAAVALYGFSGPNVRTVGSATLASVKGYGLLISTAHVLDHAESFDIFIGAKRSFLLGGCTAVRPGLFIRRQLLPSDFPTDLLCVRLKPENFEKLAEHHMCFTEREFLAERMEPLRGMFELHGFLQATNNALITPGQIPKRIDRDQLILKTLDVSPTTKFPDDLPQEHHLAFEFDKRHCYDSEFRKRTAPDPFGLSGGPAIFKCLDTKQNLLAGITVDWNAALKRIFTVNSDSVLQCIDQAVRLFPVVDHCSK
jgi:hypothetical protein